MTLPSGIAPGVFTNVTTQIAPIASPSLFTASLLGTGSNLKIQSFVVTRAIQTPTAIDVDDIFDSSNNPVLRKNFVDVLSVVDVQGRSYTRDIDFTLDHDPATGAARINWALPAPGIQPEPSTVTVTSTYTVTGQLFKTSADYIPTPISDLNTELNLYGEIESRTINRLSFTRDVALGANNIDTIVSTVDVFRLLLVADAVRFYGKGVDFKALASTASANYTVAIGVSTATSILVASSTGVVVGQVVYFTSGTEVGKSRYVTSIPDATHINVSPALSAIPVAGDTFTLYTVAPLLIKGYTEPTGTLSTSAATVASTASSIVTATPLTNIGNDTNVHTGQFLRFTSGTNNGVARFISAIVTTSTTTYTVSPAFAGAPAAADTFEIFSVATTTVLPVSVKVGAAIIVDWTPLDATSVEPAASAAYKVTVESTSTNQDLSGFTISIGYDFYRKPGSSFFIGMQFDPADGPVTPDNQGVSGFANATSGQTILAYNAALAKIFGRTDVRIVVPMLSAHNGNPGGTSPSTYAAILSTTKQHCINASSLLEGRPRFAIMGAPLNTEPTTVADAVDVFRNTQRGLFSNRFIYVNPSNLTNTYSFGVRSLDGAHFSAEVAGINANPNFNAGEPMSGKQLPGLTSIGDVYSQFQKNQIANDGGCVIELENNVPTIRQFLTTDNSSIILAEGKVTKITDVVRVTLQKGLKQMFINTRFIGPESLAQIESAANLFLKGFTGGSQPTIIEGVVDSVVQNPSDPREIDLAIRIVPAFDINFILINLQVNLNA